LKARDWVYGADSRLRAPWRILLFLVATYVCGFIAANLAGPLIAKLFDLVQLRVASDGFVILLALLGAHFFMLRVIERRPWAEVGLDAAAARPVCLARGFLFGALAVGIPILLLIWAGWLRWMPGPRTSWFAAFVRVSTLLLPAAFYEELLTRGYIFAVIRDALDVRWALVITSVAFGLLHLRNPGVSVESTALVVLAGLFLGGILVATRSLYAAWMAHFAWNWTMAVLFHTAVSGIPLESPDYRYVDAGPDWVTGGVWGPEGGVAGGLGMLGGLVYLYARRNSRRREDP
jgi:CAAX protease family protein